MIKFNNSGVIYITFIRNYNTLFNSFPSGEYCCLWTKNFELFLSHPKIVISFDLKSAYIIFKLRKI